MAAIPSARESAGCMCGTARPETPNDPESGATAPVMILMSVDLPAPFSPTSAWTREERTVGAYEFTVSARAVQADPISSDTGTHTRRRQDRADVCRERMLQRLQRHARVIRVLIVRKRDAIAQIPADVRTGQL